jgi:hypothetical protein
MINTTCGPICLLVFIIIVHRMRRELDQGNENATPQKEDIKRCIGVQYSRTKEARRNQRRNPRSGLSASAWWCTGHWCPVCTGLSGVAPDSLRREAADRRSLAVAPDCPVCTGLSGVPTGRRQRSDPTVNCYRRQRSADVACTGHLLCSVRWCTGLSGEAPDNLRREATDRRSLAVEPDCPVCQRADGNGRIQRSTATGANGRLTWRAPDIYYAVSGGAPDCPVHPTTESCCFLSNG